MLVKLFIYNSELNIPLELLGRYFALVFLSYQTFIFILGKTRVSAIDKVKFFEFIEFSVRRNSLTVFFFLHVIEVGIAIHEFIIKTSRAFCIWILKSLKRYSI